MTVGEALLAPHRSYLRSCGRCSNAGLVKGHGAYHRRRHHRESAAGLA